MRCCCCCKAKGVEAGRRYLLASSLLLLLLLWRLLLLLLLLLLLPLLLLLLPVSNQLDSVPLTAAAAAVSLREVGEQGCVILGVQGATPAIPVGEVQGEVEPRVPDNTNKVTGMLTTATMIAIAPVGKLV